MGKMFYFVSAPGQGKVYLFDQYDSQNLTAEMAVGIISLPWSWTD